MSRIPITKSALQWLERPVTALSVATVLLLAAAFCFAPPPWNYAALAILMSLWIGHKILRLVTAQRRNRSND
jgi:H+/gluconate symporter-like permease